MRTDGKSTVWRLRVVFPNRYWFGKRLAALRIAAANLTLLIDTHCTEASTGTGYRRTTKHHPNGHCGDNHHKNDKRY
jgi:adenylate kinase